MKKILAILVLMTTFSAFSQSESKGFNSNKVSCSFEGKAVKIVSSNIIVYTDVMGTVTRARSWYNDCATTMMEARERKVRVAVEWWDNDNKTSRSNSNLKMVLYGN